MLCWYSSVESLKNGFVSFVTSLLSETSWSLLFLTLHPVLVFHNDMNSKKTVAYKNAYFRNFGRKKWHDLSHELLLCITICYRLKIALCENWLLELKQHTIPFSQKGRKNILLPPKNKVEKKQWNLQIVGKLLLFQWHIFTSEVGKWRGFSLAKGGKSS